MDKKPHAGVIPVDDEGFPIVPNNWPSQLENRAFTMDRTREVIKLMQDEKDLFVGNIPGSAVLWQAGFRMKHGGITQANLALACVVANKDSVLGALIGLGVTP